MRNCLYKFFAAFGASLGVVNGIVLAAITVAGFWRGEVDTPTLSLQVALLTVCIVFGGFGLAALGMFGMKEIEKVAVRRAEELVNERLQGTGTWNLARRHEPSRHLPTEKFMK